VLDTIGIDVSQFELDHFCYRVETIERYEELKKLFEEH
jgi:predicted metalloenzyme YecM